jgi:hypothetical protein
MAAARGPRRRRWVREAGGYGGCEGPLGGPQRRPQATAPTAPRPARLAIGRRGPVTSRASASGRGLRPHHGRLEVAVELGNLPGDSGRSPVPVWLTVRSKRATDSGGTRVLLQTCITLAVLRNSRYFVVCLFPPQCKLSTPPSI